MGSLIIILLYVINIMWFIVIAHVIMSWLIGFNVLNRHQPLVWQIWNGLERLLEPIYGPIRRVLPNMGGLDLSPLVLIVILYADPDRAAAQRRLLLLAASRNAPAAPAFSGAWLPSTSFLPDRSGPSRS